MVEPFSVMDKTCVRDPLAAAFPHSCSEVLECLSEFGDVLGSIPRGEMNGGDCDTCFSGSATTSEQKLLVVKRPAR